MKKFSFSDIQPETIASIFADLFYYFNNRTIKLTEY